MMMTPYLISPVKVNGISDFILGKSVLFDVQIYKEPLYIFKHQNVDVSLLLILLPCDYINIYSTFRRFLALNL